MDVTAAIPNATLLLIDDDLVTLETFAYILRTDGYRVLTAATPETGMAEVERSRPAALLLDLHLPVTDGLKFLRQLRASPRHSGLRVAIITGDYFIDEGVADELQSLGAHIHFKPLWEDDLLRVAHGLLDSGRDAAPL
jgi:DNA-binding response OmpR family regulator